MTLPESRQRNQRYSLRGARYRGLPCLSSVPSTPSFRANSVRGSPTAARGWLLTGMLPICAANVLRLSQFGMSSGLSALRCSGGAHSTQLSGGMARRCALARAFHFGGEFFLMDEPFQGLDYGIRMEMVNMLLEIWKIKKPGVLFVTHEIDEALTVATRIAVLTPRPTTIQTWITLPGQEGRDASAPELTEIRREIIGRITA